MGEKTFDIQEMLEVLKKRKKIIIICTIVLTLLATVLAIYKMKPSYEARVKIFAGKNEEIQSNYSKDELESYSGLINTYIELIKTEDFMNKVIKKADLNIGAKQLMNELQFNIYGNTPILEIKYTSSDEKIARKVIDILTTEFEVGVKEVILNTYIRVIDSVKVTEMLPAKEKVIIIGFMAGVILGVGLIFVMDYLDDTIVKKEELEKLLPVPVLGALPFEDEKVIRGKMKNKKGKRQKKAI